VSVTVVMKETNFASNKDAYDWWKLANPIYNSQISNIDERCNSSFIDK
jgi:hypothetical protein